jgi:hypothetical protein
MQKAATKACPKTEGYFLRTALSAIPAAIAATSPGSKNGCSEGTNMKTKKKRNQPIGQLQHIL